MADVLVDADIFIEHPRGAVELRASDHLLHCSVVTRADLFAGSSATAMVTALLAPFREVPIDRSVAERSGRIKCETGVRLPNALIAATAVEHHLGSATRSWRHVDAVRGFRARALR